MTRLSQRRVLKQFKEMAPACLKFAVDNSTSRKAEGEDNEKRASKRIRDVNGNYGAGAGHGRGIGTWSIANSEGECSLRVRSWRSASSGRRLHVCFRHGGWGCAENPKRRCEEFSAAGDVGARW